MPIDLQLKGALLSGILELAIEAVIAVDEEQNIVLFNRGAEEIFGYSSEEVFGQPLQILIPEKYRALHHQHLQGFMHSDQPARHMKRRAEISGLRKNGESFPAEASISKICVNGRIIVTSILQDITERQQAYEKLVHQASHDALTDLPNRTLINSHLEHAFEVARRNHHKVAVLFLDLDRFKSVNDSLGYLIGDKLLIEVAARISTCARKEDTIGRLVGDEFIVIMEGLQKAPDAGILVNKFIDSFARPFMIEGHELFMSTSIGISIFPDNGEDSAEQISNADVAMYQAKKDDRNSYHFYTKQFTTAAVERARLESQLRCAVERKELLLHYQPQVSLKTGAIIGAEALVRWQHPEMGLISPAKFIPLAEESGLIVPIGEWVLRTACQQMAAWKRQGYSLNLMAVNVAGPQIVRTDLVSLIQDVLVETGLEARCLEVEITEGFVMHDPRQTIRLLHELKSLGILLAIDDFGTGHSSLAYLKQFPIEKLKVDQAFVKNITGGKHDAAIAHAIITLGHSLDLKVIAEGIELDEQQKLLHAMGCDEGQGYLFDRPLTAKEFEQRLL